MTLPILRVLAFTVAMLALALLVCSLAADLVVSMPSAVRQACTFGGAVLAGTAFALVRGCSSYIPLTSVKLSLLAITWNTMLILALGISFGAIGMALTILPDKGTRDGTGPLLTQPPPYQLNNHGKVTIVDRDEFLRKTISGTLGWHVAFITIAWGALFVAVFNRLPWPCSLLPSTRQTEDEKFQTEEENVVSERKPSVINERDF